MVLMDTHVFLCGMFDSLVISRYLHSSDLLQIILGSIVTRCPSMSWAPSALVQLDSACDLFSKAARGFRAVKVLVSHFRCGIFQVLNILPEHHASFTRKGSLQLGRVSKREGISYESIWSHKCTGKP